MGVACYNFFFSSRRRHTRLVSDWSSDVCSSDLIRPFADLMVREGANVSICARNVSEVEAVVADLKDRKSVV